MNPKTRALAVAEPVREGPVLAFFVRDPDHAKAEMEEIVVAAGARSTAVQAWTSR